jgi:hypothetical protein
MRRSLPIAVLALALTAACGDDEETTPSTIAPTTATSRAAASTTAPAAVAQGVTDGAVCPTSGARGTTREGLSMVCTTIAGGNETRWRPA